MYQEMLFNVGDKIKVTPYIGRPYIVEIGRVTKTQAVTKPINDFGHCLKFRRSYHGYIKKIGQSAWDMTGYQKID